MPEVIVNRSDAGLASSTAGALIVSQGPVGVPTTPANLTYDTAKARLGAPTLDHGTQGGTLASPTIRTLHRIGLRDSANGDFSSVLGGAMFDTTYNPIAYIGAFNSYVDPSYPYRTDQPTATFNIEYNYLDPGLGYSVIESYLDVIGAQTLGSDRWNVRPWFTVTDRSTGSSQFHVQLGRKQAGSGYFDVVGGYRTFTGVNTEFQIFEITGGETIADSTSQFFGALTVSGGLNCNSLTAPTTITGSLRAGTLTTTETYLGSTDYDGFGRVIFGTSQRLGNFNTLIGKNLSGQNGTTNYITPSTSSPWAGYGGIEWTSFGDFRLLLSNATTTAGGVVTPPVRLTVSGATGDATFGSAVTATTVTAASLKMVSGSATGTLGNNSFGGDWVVLTADPALGAGNFALASSVAGGTIFNAPSGRSIDLRIGNVTRASIASTGAATFSGSVAIGGGTPIGKVLSASGTLDFPSTASGATSDLTLSVTGAAVGDVVSLGLPASIAAGTGYFAWVSAVDTVTVRFWNNSGSTVDPASATFRPAVFKF